MGANEINDLVNSLKDNPLYYIMKGNRELFYSNLLAWFFNDVELKPILIKTISQFLASHNYSNEMISKFESSDCLFRENNNYDCVFKTLSLIKNKKNKQGEIKEVKKYTKTLVIENKIKDFPSFHQLDTYSQKMRGDKEGGENCIKIVLSFAKQSVQIHEDWKNIYYKDFSDLFKTNVEEAHINEEKKLFIYQYCALINILSQLVENGNNIDIGSLGEEVSKDIYSMLSKLRYSKYLNDFITVLEQKNLRKNLSFTLKEFKDSKIGSKIFVNWQYATFTGGMIEAQLKLKKNLVFIMQLQDKGLAIGLENNDREAKKIKKMPKNKEKIKAQQSFFYKTLEKLKDKYPDFKNKIYGDKIDEKYNEISEKNKYIHGYNNMVYVLEEHMKIPDLNKDVVFNEMSRILITVFNMNKTKNKKDNTI